MEKKKPTYDLAGFRLEFCSVAALRMTRTAQDCVLAVTAIRRNLDRRSQAGGARR